MYDEHALTTLLRETVDDGLYRIILSNPRQRDGAFKIKIRPVMIKGALLFQKTTYEGTQVFHDNQEREELVRQVEELLAQNFRQCEIEHRRCRAVVMVSKKGKVTVRKKLTQNTESETETDRKP